MRTETSRTGSSISIRPPCISLERERERFCVELICFWRGEGEREEDEFYSGNSGVGDDGKGRYAAVKSTKKPLLLFSRDYVQG